jgi:hypothetical protein
LMVEGRTVGRLRRRRGIRDARRRAEGVSREAGIRTYMHTHMHAFLHMDIDIHTYVLTYIQRYVHICMHIYTLPQALPRTVTYILSLNPQPSPLNRTPQPPTFNPQPSPLNPQASSLKPSTLNPKPEALNPQPSSLNPNTHTPQPSTPNLTLLLFQTWRRQCQAHILLRDLTHARACMLALRRFASDPAVLSRSGLSMVRVPPDPETLNLKPSP